MVNILVPSDFSDLSKVAALYAVKIANKLGGNVTLLHAVAEFEAVRASMRQRINTIEKEIAENAREDLDALALDLSKKARTTKPIVCKVAKGSSFNSTLIRESKKLHSGLIVMGTHGASGIKKVVLGSNTVSIIGMSHVPVLAVPEKAEFKGFRNVIYASDLKHLDKELKMLIPYIEKFNSTIHVVHVTSSGKNMAALEEKIDKAAQKSGYKKIVGIVLVGNAIDQAIDQYIEVSKADVLAMFSHGATFYEKLFDRSITRRMAFQSKIPLLAFKQK